MNYLLLVPGFEVVPSVDSAAVASASLCEWHFVQCLAPLAQLHFFFIWQAAFSVGLDLQSQLAPANEVKLAPKKQKPTAI
jgi:hypothetical protein